MGFLINNLDTRRPGRTTTLLMHRALLRGHDVFAFDVTGLSVRSGGMLWGRGVEIDDAVSVGTVRRQLKQGTRQPVSLTELNLLMLRTNPISVKQKRHHQLAMALCRQLRSHGVTVLNNPDALERAHSKLYVLKMPESVLPPTLVSSDPDALRAFVVDSGTDCVLKPVEGASGEHVFKVSKGHYDNLGQFIDVVTDTGYAVAQHYLEAASEGDVRIMLIQGRPLVWKGQVAAVRRQPAAGDFRSNVAQGGKAQPVTLDKVLEDVVEKVGPIIREDGLFMAGVDIIGGKVVEVNAHTAGGLFDAERFYGVDFSTGFIERVEQEVATT